MKQEITPLQGTKRIISLDMMRGFAILGIFLVNMLSFHSPLLYIEPLKWWSDSLDKAVYIFIDVFFQASFYPLFSMLFGYGLVIMWEKGQQKRSAIFPILWRRLFLLMLIGLSHAFLIWHGDILFNYALLGIMFLFFIRLSGKSMLIIGSILYLLPNLLITGLLLLAFLVTPGELDTSPVPYLASQSIEIYQNGTFLEITRQRIDDWSYTNNIFGLMMTVFAILPLFLIGGGAAKYKWLEQIEKYRKGLKITSLLTLIIGILLKVSPYIADLPVVLTYIQDFFGGPLLALSYGLMIALISEKKVWHKTLKPISYVGRMSLSNYLLQSLISTFIFYSYGLGMYGKVSVVIGSMLVLVIFIGQIIISKMWMKHYYYGPVEWIWRNVTYMKKQKFRRVEIDKA